MRSIRKEGFKAQRGDGEDSEDVEIESKTSKKGGSIFKFSRTPRRSMSPVWMGHSDASES